MSEYFRQILAVTPEAVRSAMLASADRALLTAARARCALDMVRLARPSEETTTTMGHHVGYMVVAQAAHGHIGTSTATLLLRL